MRRLIVVGLDGQDPKLTDRFLAEGKLPNFAKLAETGCYKRLATTFPSVSPVAWSSFATGVHPAKHNIFDFLDRDRRTYLPVLSSTKIGKIDRFLKIGKWRIPLEKPSISLMRKSKPFWTILGEYDVWSTVLRVPITFPPDRFKGAQLSAMSVPDLLGTQGTFLLFTTRASNEKFKEGGLRVVLSSNGTPDRFETKIEGPENSMVEGNPTLTIPMSIALDRAKGRARVEIDGTAHDLEKGHLSEWVPLAFKVAPGMKATGLCRMMVTEMEPHFSLYMTPISIDPDSPAMPISHPSYYATYLAKKIGPYSTLGLAEDTWALNEGVVDDGTFLRQTNDIDDERRAMFFAALDRLREGSLVCVFDATDRIQHMFWRYIEAGHPAARGKENAPHANAIEELYKRNDELVGRVMKKMKKGDLLFVISDHGFTSFRRGVNLNAWLRDNGYLVLKDGADGSAEWLRDVDWTKTRAYALGLTGMFLNIRGREAMGTVEPGAAAQALKAEIIGKLHALRDNEKNAVGVNEAFDTSKLYQGPYLQNAPDLLIGYAPGYRTSWDCASGVVAGHVFEDNVKAWSGDHCVDPREVPGRDVLLAQGARRQSGAHGSGTDCAQGLRRGAARAHGRESAVRRGERGGIVRRASLALVAVLGFAAAALAPVPARAADKDKRVIVLGFDGMDYGLARKLMSEGRMPNFSRLASEGTFQPLGTSVPPQSPVAWSNFITGMDAGGHGIFDFIHRDPKTMIPYLSTSTTEGSSKTWKIGKWQIPLSGGKVTLLRKGEPFWQRLEGAGVSTTVLRMPANFPPSGSASFELAGMGTPDLIGTYGIFSFFTTNPAAFEGKRISGGKVYDVVVRDGLVKGTLVGPGNPFVQKEPKVKREFTVAIDPVNPVAMITVGGEERVIKEGEFTDWVPIDFDLVKTQKLHGMCRFYLKQVRPDFMLYVSPINIDPMKPALPIATPSDYAKDLAESGGRFYTQGIAEDTKALSEGVFTREEFLRQATIAGNEVIENYEHALARFEKGFFFYYFGNSDQIDHMTWRTLDPGHPGYRAATDSAYADLIPSVYARLDSVVGYTLEHMGDATLVVMSDHGFTSWRRAFHLNSWLRDQGYLTLLDPEREDDPGLFANVDWARTRAYGLGINGLYLNLRGREKWGTVSPAERDSLLEDISKKLLATIDPVTGSQAVTKVYRCDQYFEHKEHLDIGPDLIVGYAKGTRGSNQSALGEIPKEVIVDNLEEWSGDHCMDHETVPGILLTNRPLAKKVTSLQNLAAAILQEFGVAGFEEGGEANLEALGYVAGSK